MFCTSTGMGQSAPSEIKSGEANHEVDERIFALIGQVVDLFKAIDSNGDGSISPLEVLAWLASQALPTPTTTPSLSAITDLMKPFASNGDGSINFGGKCRTSFFYKLFQFFTAAQFFQT